MPKSRQQRRARARRSIHPRRRSTTVFLLVLAIVLVAGSALGAYSALHRPPITRGAIVGEHWHASYKIYICGEHMQNFPTVEGEIHSHGDGFIHIHPSDASFAGDNANLGNFLQLYETTFTESNGRRVMTFPTGQSIKDGDSCPNKKTYKWVFTNKGQVVKGDPAKFLPHNGDVLVMQFGPKGNATMPNPYSQKHPDVAPGSTELPGTTAPPDTNPIPANLLTQTPTPSP
jgi:hypothetical protein